MPRVTTNGSDIPLFRAEDEDEDKDWSDSGPGSD